MTTKSTFLSLVLFILALFVYIPKAHALTFSPPRFEISGNPGQIIEKEMTLTNEGADPQTFYSVFRNFEAEGETGVPSPTDSDTGLASWITTEEKITIPPKSSQLVAFQIHIPGDAEPGGYFAMILWSTVSPNALPGQVAIGAQTGPLVLLSVNGNVKIAGGITEFGLRNGQTFYTALPVSFFYKFKNDGGDRVKPTGDIKIKNILGLSSTTIPANRVEGNVLPSGTRRFETEWQSKGDHADTSATLAVSDDLGFFGNVKHEWHNFAFGRYTAKLALTYGADANKVESTVKFTVFPWHLLLTILLSLIILYFIIKKLIRNYNRFIIRQATMALEQMEEMKDHRQAERSQPLVKRSYEEQPETLDLRAKKTPRRKI